MDRDEIVNLLRRSYELSYEDLEVAEIGDLDLNRVKEFIEKARKTRLTTIVDDALTVLRNLGLINNKANVAAVLLFGKNPQSIVPWATVKVGKFVGEEIVPRIEREINGNIVEQVERSYIETLSLIRREVKVKGLVREEVYEYSPEAIREIIVNAITHRDYSIRSSIYIKILEQKIVIENPGGLPAGISVDDLRKPHRSILRNPKMANVLYNLGYIEKWGIGTLEVIKKCIFNGNGEPIFDSNGTFKVEIRSRYAWSMNDEEEVTLKYIKERGKATRRELEKNTQVKGKLCEEDT